MPKWNNATEALFSRVTSRLKRRRVDLFVRALGLGPDSTVLDLGSEDGSCLAPFYPYPQNILLADIHEEPMRRGVDRYGLKGYIVLPKEGAIPIATRSFDAVWCNSVIEHVSIDRSELHSVSTLELHTRTDKHQRLFAREISRIGRSWFVQTPYLHFPIEAHSWLPGVQYLPHQYHILLSSMLKKLWIKQWTPDFYLYDFRRFREHFADATTICAERVCGVPKSLIAIRSP